MSLRRDLRFDAALVSIEDWAHCLVQAPFVTSVEKVLKLDGTTTRKSDVAPDVVQRGGGHLCS